MFQLSGITGQIILTFLGVFILTNSMAQVPTYTVDSNFDSGELFKDGAPVYDIYLHGDGRYLVGGGFNNFQSPVFGLGMVNGNGSWDNSWGSGFEYYDVLEIIAQEDGYIYPSIGGMEKILLEGIPWPVANQGYWSDYFMGGTNNPYNVERMWDIYQLDNGDLLIGGAIATDTLQPGLLRGITRMHANGSHDPTFPILNITPNNAGGAVRKIYPAADGSWFISGSFTAINGHETNHVAHLTPEFVVDTNFVSPFMYDGPVPYTENIILVDDQNRVWVSGYDMRLQGNPNDTIQLCRLLPNGLLDPAFPLIKLKNEYPDGWSPKPNVAVFANELVAFPGNYMIYGSFNYYNDIAQSCVTVVNAAGVMQNNFFQGQGASINLPYGEGSESQPGIYIIKQLNNGGLIIGGAFSQFMGEERYSVVKLKPDSITANPPEIEQANFKLYPNPSKDMLYLSSYDSELVSGTVYNAIGQEVLSFTINTNKTQVDIRRLEPGIYFVKVQMENGQMGVRKFVKGR